jgi:carbamoylphosphate synthase large subunit
MHVLLLDTGAPSSPAVMRALKRAGARVTVGARRGTQCTAAASRFCDGVAFHPPLDRGAEVLAFFRDLVRTRAIDVVLPILDDDLMALAPYRRELEEVVPLALAPAACVANALDKSATVALACRSVEGLRVPITIAPAAAAEAVAPWAGRFPVIVKPRVGSGGRGMRMARDAAELEAVFALVDRDHPRPLVQERVEYGPGEKFVLLYLFDHRGELRSWYGQRVLLESKSLRVGTGSARARGGVALLWESHKDQALLQRGRLLLESLGWRGLAAIECARDRRDGHCYLFEINGRLDGTTSLSLRQGPNFAHDACLVALSRTPPLQLDFVAGRRARKSLFAMLEAMEPRAALAILDPRFPPPVPIRLDPAPVVREAARLLRKRLPTGMGRASHRGAEAETAPPSAAPAPAAASRQSRR